MNKFTSSDSHFAFADDVNLANRCPAAFADSHFMMTHVEAEKKHNMVCLMENLTEKILVQRKL
jgi:hypothetical protein